MKICPIALQICQNKLKILPNTKWTLSKWPKCFNILPKWRNFAKSGHTLWGWKKERKKERKEELKRVAFKTFKVESAAFAEAVF